MQYNTSRELLIIKEYGRSVQNMVKHLLTIEDKEKRQQNAEAIVDIMAILSPQQKNIEDYRQKLWDHLFLITDYQLEVDSPYPMPSKELKQQKPEPLPYPKQKIRWNHFGKSFENLFEKAMAETDEEKKQGYVVTLALFMKIAYNNWHKENIHDDMIKDELYAMSKGKLVFEPGSRFTEFVDVGDGATIRASQKVFKRYGNFKNNNNRQNNYSNNNNNRNNKYNKFRKKNNNNSM